MVSHEGWEEVEVRIVRPVVTSVVRRLDRSVPGHHPWTTGGTRRPIAPR
jgi:hypothetical protein